jgi:hypothetical protein
MPKPICVKCKRFFKPHRTGVWPLEQMPTVSGAQPGTREEAAWQPYKIWSADLYRCEGCGGEIIVGFGQNRVSEHFEADFDKWLPRVTHTVNDC